jgi:hypothetical protein
MKYKINESQKELITQMRQRGAVKEQEFIDQARGSNQLGEAVDDGLQWYTVDVTVLGGLDNVHPAEITKLSKNAYFKLVIEDAKRKIEEAFNTKEYTINAVSNKLRGEINPLYLD